MNPYISLGKVKINVFSYVFLLVLYVLNGFFYIGLIILSAFIHECGHFFACCVTGARIRCVDISFFGARIVLEDSLSSYKDDLAVFCAGPLASLLASLLFFVLFLNFKTGIFLDLFFCNLFLFLFNSLPIASLDGGNALYSYLCQRYDIDTATRVSSAFSLSFSLLLLILAFALLKSSDYNFSLLTISAYLFISANKKSYVGFPT